jgi:hypothetical protein
VNKINNQKIIAIFTLLFVSMSLMGAIYVIAQTEQPKNVFNSLALACLTVTITFHFINQITELIKIILSKKEE